MSASDATQRADRDRYAAIYEEARAIHGVSLGRDAWRRLRRNPVAMVCLATLVMIVALAIFTPLLPLQPPQRVDTPRQYQPPILWPLMERTLGVTDDGGTILPREVSKAFGDLGPIARALLHLRVALFGDWSCSSFFGTDELGRDVLARVFWGARVSLAVGLVAALVSLVIGVSYGAIAGYSGGQVDNAMMRLVDVLYSIPFTFVAIFIITVLSADEWKRALESVGITRITVFFFVVGAIYWLTMARVVRGQVISLKNDQFIEAARTIGASQTRIIFRHLVPNLLSVVIVYLTLTIPRVMLFEAFLSFLGLGVEPPDVSWGLMANQGFRVITAVKVYWWLVVFPALALGVTLFSLNFLGDGLRDALDPRLKNK